MLFGVGSPLQRVTMCTLQAHAQDSSLTVAKLGLAQIDLLKGERTNAITLLEGTLQEVTGWLDALKVMLAAAAILPVAEVSMNQVMIVYAAI